jgi:hypothetical protein
VLRSLDRHGIVMIASARRGDRMRRHVWLIVTAVVLLGISAGLHFAHHAIFHRWEHLLLYGLGDLAFLPIEILLVVVVVERLLSRQERREVLHKMNMLIGTFFSEVGMQLLGLLTEGMAKRDALRARLAVKSDWTARDFKDALTFARQFPYRFTATPSNLASLKSTLAVRRDLLVLLLANPNLLEHESFTDLLWSVFHYVEELDARSSLQDLPPADLEHLSGDAERIYSRLAVEWLHYARHLKTDYPYIYSIIARTNPLQENPSPVVEETP